MGILTEIHRSTGININGRTIYRVAVRGVVLRGRDLLMIHSEKVGDYKFPGGGMDEGETHFQTLSREIQEETGKIVSSIGPEIGAIVEYKLPRESEYDVFKMTSYYYACEVYDGSGIQALEDYEQELGFRPVWINIEKAIEQNMSLLHSHRPPEWLRREIFMLDHLEKKFQETH